MLSYQHQFHAGNLADVHKHAVLAAVLAYLTQKDKPVSYIETHAGRALYDLAAPEALKTGEAAGGVRRVESHLSPAHPYRQRLSEARAQAGADAYPGSPMIAALSLRDTDTLHLCELHPQEATALAHAMLPWGAHIHRADGPSQALALTPPTPRRGLMLIDPSWEVKDDYTTIPKLMAALHRKWNVGILMLWYPLLAARTHTSMLAALEAAFPDAHRHEVRFPPIRPGHRMEGSGLFTVNAPFGFDRITAEVAAAIRAATC